MSIFNDESFDAVACNAVLEHDKFFWKTITEVKRILKPGGLFYVGVPGYSERHNLFQKALMKVIQSATFHSVPLLYRLAQWALLTRLASTPTYLFHAAPDDFYRFSEGAIREVFLEGFVILHLECMLDPVRIIGVGNKPRGNNL